MSRLKYAAVIVLFIVFTGIVSVRLIFNSMYDQYKEEKRSNFHISFQSDRPDIDSIQFSICEEITLLSQDRNRKSEWYGKIISPPALRKNHGSCAVEIIVCYTNTNTNSTPVTYFSKSMFDCPQCDGVHHYRIAEGELIYEYSP